MDEAEKIFNQTSYERKRTGYGAYHKKGGCKSKRCSLPSDRLTAKEKEALNGELTTFKLGAPMDWHTFKCMPADLQYDYLKCLRDKYEGRDKDIAEMFGIQERTFSAYKAKHFRTLKGTRGGAVRRDVSPAWLAFINTEAETSDEVTHVNVIPYAPEEDEEEELPAIPQPLSAPPVLLGVTGGTIRFTGSREAFLQCVERMLEDGVAYRLALDFTKEAE